MNPVVIGGLVVSLLGIVAATVMDGNSFGPLVGPSSIVLVLMGAIGASLMGYRLDELARIPTAMLKVVDGSKPDLPRSIAQLAEMADVARREGMLALESRLDRIEDAFAQRGLQLIVDGLDADEIRDRLEIDIAAVDERHRLAIDFFKTMGKYAPTFGMIGTVIGLINMLGNLTSPEQLGSGMSVALLTTLYGVMFANLIFLPIATRLERLNESELASRDVVLDGVLSLQRGMAPRGLVERLETYLAPDERRGYQSRPAGDAGLREVA